MIVGVLLAAIGLGIGIYGYANPQEALKTINAGATANDVGIMVISARNIGMATIMILALLSKVPRLIGLVFIMRFVTEAQDLIATISGSTNGIGGVWQSVIFIGLILFAEALAIIKMNKMGNELAQQQSKK